VAIRGLLENTRNDAVELKAKYAGPTFGTGQLGVGLGVKWAGDTTLELTSTRNIYIAGELVSLNAGGFGMLSGGLLFKKIVVRVLRVEGSDALR
jgi:hypothetical protein